MKPNAFFNPADCPFEVLGFFEEYIDMGGDYPKVLGTKTLSVDEAPRLLGAPGRKEQTVTAPLTLMRGYREVVVRASPARPLRVVTMVQILCGKSKY